MTQPLQPQVALYVDEDHGTMEATAIYFDTAEHAETWLRDMLAFIAPGGGPWKVGLDLAEFAKQVSRTAHEHGWWENGDRNMGEMIALMHSELSEALEAYRDQEPVLHYKYTGYAPARFELQPVIKGELGKPCGIASEFADTIIRILDTCETLNIPIVEALVRKAAYNETRPYRHGGKLA